jgi:hypothetical protein
MTCDKCGGNRLQMCDAFEAFIREQGLTHEWRQVDGRVLWFGEDRILVPDDCFACDQATIRTFLANRAASKP